MVRASSSQSPVEIPKRLSLPCRGLSPATSCNCLLYCRKFAAFFMRSPEQLGAAEVRTFLLHQIEVDQLAYASYRQVYAALKFLYCFAGRARGRAVRHQGDAHRTGLL